jgi:hypothetical protein
MRRVKELVLDGETYPLNKKGRHMTALVRAPRRDLKALTRSTAQPEGRVVATDIGPRMGEQVMGLVSASDNVARPVWENDFLVQVEVSYFVDDQDVGSRDFDFVPFDENIYDGSIYEQGPY